MGKMNDISKKMLVSDIITRILEAYDENGNTIERYSENIILPDLTQQEYDYLVKISEN